MQTGVIPQIPPNKPKLLDQVISNFPAMLIVFFAAMWSIAKIPSIVNSIFSGAAGQATPAIVINRR